MFLGDNIRFLRKRREWSQDDLAARMGYKSFTTIQKWESGVADPPLKVVAQLAELFGVDIDVLTSVNMEAMAADHWTETFREKLTDIIPNVDREDAAASGVDIEQLSEVASGDRPISLGTACDIASSLGRSLDDMVGNKNAASGDGDGRIREFAALFNCLTPDQQNLVIAQIKGILSAQ